MMRCKPNLASVESDPSHALTWRLIPPIQTSGSLQMALDSWLFEQHCLGLHPPTLRFSTWFPAAISLGYHQRRYPEHWQHLTWQGKGLELVRRPTGGRAVLHQGDLTYTVVASGIPGSRLQTYRTVCEFLIQGWRSLGIQLDYGPAGRGYIHNPDCFGTATGADLVCSNGTKMIGSAQLRRGSALLQQGSIRLNPDPQLFHQVFGVESELLELPHDLSKPDAQTIVDALIQAATRCFGVHLVAQPLSSEEWQAVSATSRISP